MATRAQLVELHSASPQWPNATEYRYHCRLTLASRRAPKALDSTRLTRLARMNQPDHPTIKKKSNHEQWVWPSRRHRPLLPLLGGVQGVPGACLFAIAVLVGPRVDKFCIDGANILWTTTVCRTSGTTQ